MALVSVLVMSSFVLMKKDKSLEELWYDYEKARERDRIRDMIDILEDLKAESLKRRATADYFKASDEYVNARSRRNWRDTDSLIVSTKAELREYGLPSLEILFGLRHGDDNESIIKSIEGEASAMKGSADPDLYAESDIFAGQSAEKFNELMANSIKNDYEFILWAFVRGRGYGSEWAYDRLEECLEGRYPAAPYVRYMRIMSGREQEAMKRELESLADEYAGRGIGLLAEDALLDMRFWEMEDKASSDDYRKFEKELETFKKRHSQLKGDEAAVAELCMNHLYLQFALQSQNATGNIRDGRAMIVLRNYDKIGLKISKEKETVYETELVNPAKSFYRKDTLYIDLPVLDDGKYIAELLDGKKVVGSASYRKYTISLAERRSGGVPAIYAADYMTGEPFAKADLLLYDKEQKKIAEVKDFAFDGFTPLPKDIYPFKNDEVHYIECRYIHDGLERHSAKLSLRNRNQSAARAAESRLSATIMKDRAAFIPGDTVRFKAVIYETHPDGSMTTLPEGSKILARLADAEDKPVSEISLKTNEFGSVSGSFAIPGGRRNGSWIIYVFKDGRNISSSVLKVEEFVLPTYDLSFDKTDKIYFPGDEIKVTGKVKNFTGHGFGGLEAVAEIVVNNKKVTETPVAISSDGSFEVSFTAGTKDDNYVGYSVLLRLTDRTGETFGFDYNGYIRADFTLNASLCNGDSGQFGKEKDGASSSIFSGGTAKWHCTVRASGMDEAEGIPVDYELIYRGKAVRSGKTESGDTLSLSMSGLASGYYELSLKASAAGESGRTVSASREIPFLYLPADAKVMPEGVDRMFRTEYENGKITMQLGTSAGELWAVVELFGEDGVLLKKEMQYLRGTAGEPGSLTTLEFQHLEEYSDNLQLNVFYFRNGTRCHFNENFSRPEEIYELPLEFSSFVDKALPGQEYTIRFKTDPAAEILASIYDASSDKIYNNSWYKVSESGRRIVSVNYNPLSGYNGSQGNFGVIGYGRMTKRAMASNAVMMDASAVGSYDAVEEEAVSFSHAEAAAAPAAEVEVRDDFATTLAFEPYLRPSADGTAALDFRTSDKLSTFRVMVYAHNQSMDNALITREMLVTLPLKVSVAAPQYLYVGDEYVLNASVSNTSAAALRGTVYLEVYDGREYMDVEPLRTDSVGLDVPAGGSASCGFRINVPDGVEALGFKVVFAGHEYSADAPVNEAIVSDGVFVPVPAYPDAQVLTEAHSAVLPGGQSADQLLERLRDEFVNVSPEGAEYKEISIMDMLREAIPMVVESEGKDVVSQSGVMYVNLLAAGLRAAEGEDAREYVQAAVKSMEKVLACANADGGFGWFDDIPSTPDVTALVLERYAALRDRGLLDMVSEMMGEDALDSLDEVAVAAVEYLDSAFFGGQDRPVWYGRIQGGKYVYVRSMFAGVPFDAEAARTAMGGRAYRKFQKGMRGSYYAKGQARVWLPDYAGLVLGHARSVRLLANLTASEQGLEMAAAWGLSSGKKLRRSLEIEYESLKQYAVESPSGGVYYPNAVAPWRGLLETEAYAHAMICDFFDKYSDVDPEAAELADGLRIWMMLQKEAQEWTSDPGFVEALASVYEGSETVKDTKVIVLSKKYSKPFDEIKAAGNGFRVSVDYYRTDSAGERVRLADGDPVHVGDRITAVYSLWSAENRSHVRLSVPRAACFRPVNQLSGWNGGWIRPLRYGIHTVTPYSYREVRADRTLWWIDVFPWEDTKIEEELFVTQEGVFTSPVAEIESLYASHYRANSGFTLCRTSLR